MSLVFFCPLSGGFLHFSLVNDYVFSVKWAAASSDQWETLDGGNLQSPGAGTGKPKAQLISLVHIVLSNC